MSSSSVRSVTSNQDGVHKDLMGIVARHQTTLFKRPIAEHTLQAFHHTLAWLGDFSGSVILDACCGVGESTSIIASQHTSARVIGVDKSISRLQKHAAYADDVDKNYILVQADLQDFWRLLASYIQESRPLWKVVHQYILYPNPYPKKAQLGKRWHASPVFKDIVAVCPTIEVRSNWLIYLQEFLKAAQCYSLQGTLDEINKNAPAMTPFERKYLSSNQSCFKLVIRLSGRDK